MAGSWAGKVRDDLGLENKEMTEKKIRDMETDLLPRGRVREWKGLGIWGS